MKKKLAIIDKCEDKISFYLNDLVYIRKMHELDVIKFFLLSLDHYKIFNFLSGPSVLINDNPNNIYKLFRDQQEEIKINIYNNVSIILNLT